MILVVTALHCEARPIITHFKLKKDAGSTKFDVYSNEEMSLVVSGTGILKCAVATTFLLTYISAKRVSGIFNIGICGAVSPDIEIGTPVLFHKIVNTETGKTYYPDMLTPHCLTEGTLQSSSAPVVSDNPEPIESGFVDMEAAGFMEAAGTFLPPHSIYCLKLVSDHLDRLRLDPGFVGELIQKNLGIIENIMKTALALNTKKNEILDSTDNRLLEDIGKRLMLSVSMQHLLKDWAIQYKIRTGSSLDCLHAYTETQVKSKREGKVFFEDIRQRLVNG